MIYLIKQRAWDAANVWSCVIWELNLAYFWEILTIQIIPRIENLMTRYFTSHHYAKGLSTEKNDQKLSSDTNVRGVYHRGL